MKRSRASSAVVAFALALTSAASAQDGACCFDAAQCVVTDEVTCTDAGGTFLGAGTSCDQCPGACCLPDPGDGSGVSCVITDAADCGAQGGVFLGNDTDCAECSVVACAQGDVNCQEPNIPQFPGGTILTSALTADNFIPTVTGDVTSLCFWGAYIDLAAPADCDEPLPTDSVTITFFPSLQSIPPVPDISSPTSFTIASAALMRTATGLEFELAGFPEGETVSEYEWTATLPGAGFSVTAGECYWIVIENDIASANENCSWFWEVSPEAQNDPGAGEGDDFSLSLVPCDVNDDCFEGVCQGDPNPGDGVAEGLCGNFDTGAATAESNDFEMAWCLDVALDDRSACEQPLNEACVEPMVPMGEGSCVLTNAMGDTLCQVVTEAQCDSIGGTFTLGASCLRSCALPGYIDPSTGLPYPGCIEAECCTLVCDGDEADPTLPLPLCCLNSWDANCAQAAIERGCSELLPEPCSGLADADCQLPDLSGHGGNSDDIWISVPSDEAIALRVADNFTPAVSGDVTQLCWWGIYAVPGGGVTCDPLPADAFTVTYYADDGNGLPGAVLGEFAVSPTRVQDQEFDFGGGLIFPQFRYNAMHDPVAVTEGECYWIEITNNLDGATCQWEWSTAPSVNEMPAGTGDEYSLLDDLTGYDIIDGKDLDYGFCTNLELADVTACLPPLPMEQCAPGEFVLTQSVDLTILETGLRCGVAGAESADTGQARSYDLSQGATAGQDVSVACVEFAATWNFGGAVPISVNVYDDPTGGDPGDVDLVNDLLGSTEVVVPANVPAFDPMDLSGGAFMRAVFDPPLSVGVDRTIVVEMFQPDRTPTGVGYPQVPEDGGDIGIASNALGQTAPSYIRSDSCGLPSFADDASIGFPDIHLVQEVHLTTSAPPCPWDCGDGDGTVGTPDFLALLGQWQDVGTSCDFDGGGVGTTDFLALLANWGDCPQ